MASFFDVTAGQASTEVEPGGSAELGFDLHNPSSRERRVSVVVVPQPPAPLAWFTLRDGVERTVSGNGTIKVVVDVRVPAATAPGRYAVQLKVASVSNPDEEFTFGQSTAVLVKDRIITPPPPPLWLKRYWWIALIALAVVITAVVLLSIDWRAGLHEPCGDKACGAGLACTGGTCLRELGGACEQELDCLTLRCEAKRCTLPARGMRCHELCAEGLSCVEHVCRTSNPAELKIYELWTRYEERPPLPTVECGSLYTPGGLRNFNCWASTVLHYGSLQALLPMPIFVRGPHSPEALSYRSYNSFGYYNPEFVRWMVDKGVPGDGDSDPAFQAASRQVYQRFFRVPARIFFFAKRILDQDQYVKRVLLDEYRAIIDSAQAEYFPGQRWYATFPQVPNNWEAQTVGMTAIGFWLRRSIDGTDTTFEAGITRVLRTYDAEWLQDALSTPPGAAGPKINGWFSL